MATLSFLEKRQLEQLFGMSTGYVLNFSNRTIQEFVADSTGRDIYDLKYERASGSKANRLRAFWKREPNDLVGKLLADLIAYSQAIEAGDERLRDACRKIAQRLQQGAPVRHVQADSTTRQIMKAPSTITAFISYKWQDQQRNAWVEQLYADLRARGIDAKLDKYEVAPGQSFSDYMTSGIRGADHVLLVVTPEAVRAVESGAGALAFEMQISNARRLSEEGAFSIIPIFREGEATSTYLSDHRYLDFRDDAQYESQLAELVRWMIGGVRPPPLGVPVPLSQDQDTGAMDALHPAGVASSDRRHLRYYFLAGCGVGNKLAIVPIGGTDDSGLEEFLESLERIGLSDAHEFERIGRLRSLPGFSPEALRVEGKALVEDYFEAMNAIPDTARARSTDEEFAWFTLGKLLYDIPSLAAVDDDSEKSTEPLLTALEMLLDRFPFPDTLKKQVLAYVKYARDHGDAEGVMSRANTVSRAVYSVL